MNKMNKFSKIRASSKIDYDDLIVEKFRVYKNISAVGIVVRLRF